MRADVTSFFSQKLFDSFGWQTISEIEYKDYVDTKGVALIRTEHPHLKYELKYKLLN